MNSFYMPELPLEPPTVSQTKCEEFQNDIYVYEVRFLMHGNKWVCKECFMREVTKNPVLLAHALGVEVEVYAR